MKKLTAYLLAFFLILCLSGCDTASQNQSSGVSGGDGSTLPGSEQMITLEGLGEEIGLTVDALKSMEFIEKQATTRSSNDTEKTYQIKGVTLDEILKAYGKKQSEFPTIMASSADGYQIGIQGAVLANRVIIIAYEVNGEELSKPRLCIPDERAMYWVKNLSVLDFAYNEVQQPTKKIVLLETAIAGLERVEYKYNDSIDKAVKVSDIAQYFANPADFVTVKAADGLKKTEPYDVFAESLIKIDGKDAPLLGTPEAQKGMKVKELQFVQCDDTAVIFAGNGTTVGALLEELDVPASGVFILTGQDGKTIEFSAGEAASAVISVSGDGTAETGGLKKLISIEVKGQ